MNNRADAMFNLGYLQERGAEGVEQDGVRAVELYERAINEHNDAGAMNNLGILLWRGAEGVEQDGVRAVKLFERAINEHNHARAMNNLGNLLSRGAEGVEQDGVRAVKLYERAINEHNDADAMNNLGILLERGAEGVEQDRVRAGELYERQRRATEGQQNTNRSTEDREHVGEAYAIDIHNQGDEALTNLDRSTVESVEHSRHGNPSALASQRAKLPWPSFGADIPPVFRDRVTIYRIVRSAFPRIYNSVTKTAAVSSPSHWHAPASSEGSMSSSHADFVADMQKKIGTTTSRAVAVFVRDAVLAALSTLDDPVRVSNTLNNVAILYFGGPDPTTPRSHLREEYLDLLERSVSESKDSDKARANLAMLLWRNTSGEDGEISRAIKLLEEAISISALPRYRVLLARVLVSPRAGSFRNAARSKEVWEKAIQDDMFIPAITDLAKLLKRGDLEVPADEDRARRLLALVQKRKHSMHLNEVEKPQIVDYHESRVYVEAKLREAKVKQSQLYLLVLGGGARGKTSLVRSLRRLSFVSGYDPTELASVSRIPFLVGNHDMTEEELNELAHRQDSLAAIVSRLPQPSDVERERGGDKNPNSKETGQKLSSSSTPVDGSENSVDPDMKTSGRKRARTTIDREEHWKQQRMSPAESPPPAKKVSRRVERFQHVYSRIGDASKTLSTSVDANGTILQCWDLAGQSQYIMAHALFVKNGNMFVFVINLKRLWEKDTRLDEIRELCGWMQLVYALLEDPTSAQPIIVGTRKDNWLGDLSELENVLLDGLMDEVGEAIYDTWIRAGTSKANGEKSRIDILAVENSTVLADAQESGIGDVEKVIKKISNEIVSSRQEVPLRWIAFMEEMERTGAVVLNKHDISACIDGFPAFSRNIAEREADALAALRYFSKLGRVVFLEISEDTVYLFPRPTVMLEFVRRVTGPEELARRRLRQRDVVMLKEGFLTRKGLETLWHSFSEETCGIMLDVLCSVDLLVRVPDLSKNATPATELIGIPALLPKTDRLLNCTRKKMELELRMKTSFVDAFPPGLMGCLVTNLHNAIGARRTKIGRTGRDGMILGVQLALKNGERVVVCFNNQQRQLEWRVFGRDPVTLGHHCLRAVEKFLEKPLRGKRVNTNHLLMSACRQSEDGCGNDWSVEFKISKGWTKNSMRPGPTNLEGDCISGCERSWMLFDLLPVSRSSEQSGVNDERQRCDESESQGCVLDPKKPVDVFISYAGPDKVYIAHPLFKKLKANGLNCFLALVNMKPGDCASSEMVEAMQSAKVGIFILSPEFAARKWTMRELRCFLERRKNAAEPGPTAPVLFPVFYRLSIDECMEFEADRYRDEKGMNIFEVEKFYSEARQKEATLDDVKRELREITEFIGIKNEEEASNNMGDPSANDARIALVDRIVYWVMEKHTSHV